MERLREVLKEGAKVRNAEERKQEFEKKELEKKRKKDERKEDKREEKRSRGEEVPAQEGGASSSTGLDVQMEVEVPGEEMCVDEVSRLVEVWVHEVQEAGEVEEDEEGMQILQEVWDDVHGGE